MIKNILFVGLGGFTGSIARYLMYVFVDKNLTSLTPLWSTFLVNMLGSAILGFIVGLSIKSPINPDTRLLLSVGFCGSFTTFSTFAVENLQLLQEKHWIHSGTYLLASIAIGIAAAFLGYSIGKSV